MDIFVGGAEYTYCDHNLSPGGFDNRGDPPKWCRDTELRHIWPRLGIQVAFQASALPLAYLELQPTARSIRAMLIDVILSFHVTYMTQVLG